jgi:hypothetical protein
MAQTLTQNRSSNMTQQNNSQITEADLQMLLAQNPMAAEQLRRIVAERIRGELQSELDELKSSINGTTEELVAVEEVV